MPRKKVLKTRVSDDVYEVFNKHAENNCKNSASMLMVLINSFLESNGYQVEYNSKYKNRSGVIHTRLNKHEHKVLDIILEKERASTAEYLLSLIRTRINKEPHFIKNELNNLRESNRQLLSVGRNINQIARAINTGKINAGELDFTAEDLEKIKKIISDQAHAISKLIKKNIDRGVVDDE